MNYIQLPGSNTEIYPGTVISISRFPKTKWVLDKDWYEYEGERKNGWYVYSIPAGTVIPLDQIDLDDISVEITDCGCCNKDNICPPKPPCPCPPGPPCPPKPQKEPKEVEVYYTGVDYEKGQLIYLNTGTIYQATTDFKSSYKLDTVEENLNKDITDGNLIAIPDGHKIEDIETSISELSNATIHRDIVGENKTLVTKVEGAGTDNGFSFTVTNANVDDGTPSENSFSISLTDMGTVSSEDFNKIANWKDYD